MAEAQQRGLAEGRIRDALACDGLVRGRPEGLTDEQWRWLTDRLVSAGWEVVPSTDTEATSRG